MRLQAFAGELMEILAIQLKSNATRSKFAAFVHKSVPESGTSSGRAGSSSLKLLRTAIPALKDDQHVIVTPEFSLDSGCDEVTEFCEVFYQLDRGQWFVWPSALAEVS